MGLVKLRITIEGESYEVDVEVLEQDPAPVAPPVQSSPSPTTALIRKNVPMAGDGKLVSPLVGVIADVLVSPGQQVEAGQLLVVLEAMKMETEITAPSTGTVQDVAVSVGETVRQGQLLVDFASAD